MTKTGGTDANPLGAVTEPDLGCLYLVDDEDNVYVHEIATADFNVYTLGGYHWLTLYVRAKASAEPERRELEPFLEINVPFEVDPQPLLREGHVVKVDSYHDKLFNLASLYYWTHLPFDGEVLVESARAAELTLRVSGEADYDPVLLRATFLLNSSRRRSFS